MRGGNDFIISYQILTKKFRQATYLLLLNANFHWRIGLPEQTPVPRLTYSDAIPNAP